MCPGFAPPPDFRYISLEPTQGAPNLKGRAICTGAVVCGVGVMALGSNALALTWALGLGVGAAWFVLRRPPRHTAAVIDIEHIAIVPWGVVVHAGSGPRVLRWGAIDSIHVRYQSERESATPVIRWSEVTLRARTETIVGRARGLAPLERLEAHLASYAQEAGRPIALDAAATTTAVSDLEPVFPRLLDEVHRSVRAPDAIPELGLDARGYRGGSQRDLGTEGLGVLRRWLTEDAAALGADRRPLAAVLAAELRARPLLETLMALVTSPHPFVAAVARSAALRLGAELRRVGSLQELSDFVAAAELEAMGSWGARP
ncbi:MAG TPA: hypothetical protein VI197_10170 [Polyangiaceae bacterium]